MLNNTSQKWCPAARQGPFCKPTRLKFNPKSSYYSSGAFWWVYHPVSTFSGFPKNKQAQEPHHTLLTVIVGEVYPTDDVRAEWPWHWGLRRPPSPHLLVSLGAGRVTKQGWKGGKGAWPHSSSRDSQEGLLTWKRLKKVKSLVILWHFQYSWWSK